MNNSGMFGEILETGQSTVKNVAKSAATGTQNFAKATVGQVTGSDPSTGTNEANDPSKKQLSDDQAQQFLKDLYGKSDKKMDPSQLLNSKSQQNPIKKAVGIKPKDPNAGKTPEEIVKIEALRRQLHGGYYQQLIQRPKREESVVEKIEREDEEDRMKLFEKEKKKPSPLPATVKQGTGETMVGVSG